MDKEEIKIEYKDPVQFRPHPENVVRDVIMYHIYRNEGMMCNDDLIQYIKNKIIDDLNAIFMLYEYAPDAIKTIKHLMSSKHHHGTEDSYHEMMFHALTIKNARDILIEQISNVLIKCIPEPLGNIKFDVIMKDEIMDNNEKESSIEEDVINDREVRIENRMKEFLNCKSETEKAMMFPRHDLVRLAVSDIIINAVEKYQNEFDLVSEAWRKGEMKHISKETIMSGFIFLAMGRIKQTFIVDDIAVKQIEKSIEHILDDSLNIPTREKGIDNITTNIWYSFYDTYFKNVLAFPKPVEESSTDATDKPFDFAVKSVSAKLYNHIFKIVDDLIDKSCAHISGMIVDTKTFRIFPGIEYNEYKIAMLSRTIGHALHTAFDIAEGIVWHEVNEAITIKFKFKHYLDPRSNQAFIRHVTDFVCRNLSFDKQMELEKEISQHEQEIEKVKSDIKGNDPRSKWIFNELHKAMDKIGGTRKIDKSVNHKDNKEHPKETIMKGNPQNIEVGDVVSYTSIGDSITSVVLSVCDQGYTTPENVDAIDGYLVRATVMNKSTICNYPVNELTIVRKWNESIPSKQAKQSEVKSQPTYLFEMLTDKSIETIELAVELIEGLSSADIMEVYRDNHSVVVTQNFVNKLCEFVNTKRHVVDRDIKFDGSDFWENLERLNPQCFLDYIVERIIIEELKRRTLSNE